MPQTDVPSYEQAWFDYRMWSWNALYAFVVRGDVTTFMDSYQTEIGVQRILAGMERIDAAGALYQLLDRRHQHQ